MRTIGSQPVLPDSEFIQIRSKTVIYFIQAVFLIKHDKYAKNTGKYQNADDTQQGAISGAVIKKSTQRNPGKKITRDVNKTEAQGKSSCVYGGTDTEQRATQRQNTNKTKLKIQIKTGRVINKQGKTVKDRK